MMSTAGHSPERDLSRLVPNRAGGGGAKSRASSRHPSPTPSMMSDLNHSPERDLSRMVGHQQQAPGPRDIYASAPKANARARPPPRRSQPSANSRRESEVSELSLDDEVEEL